MFINRGYLLVNTTFNSMLDYDRTILVIMPSSGQNCCKSNNMERSQITNECVPKYFQVKKCFPDKIPNIQKIRRLLEADLQESSSVT